MWTPAIVAVCVISVSGCYSPAYQDCQLRCTTSQACPSGLSCLETYCRDNSSMQTCEAVLGDAQLADSLTYDRDDDRIPDDRDNCPVMPNTEQDNEDGDAYGDICDPCPIGATTFENMDTDGDGVGGGCDPNLLSGKPDRVVVFDGLNRKPEAPAVIAESTGGAWMFVDGQAIAVTTTNADYVTLGWPSPEASKTREVRTKVTFVSEAGADTGAGPMDGAPQGSNMGWGCLLWNDPVNLHQVAIVQLPSPARTAQAFAFNAQTPPVELRLYHPGSSPLVSCTLGTQTLNVPTATFVQPSLIGIRSQGMRVKFDWVMVVEAGP